MGEKSPKVLITRIKINNSIKSDVKTLDLRQNLFHFCIDSDMNVNESKPFPRLEEQFHRNRTRINVSLEEGFETMIANNKLIDNYEKYRTQKWIHFLKCLQKYEIIAKEKPTIVCFGGVLSELLGIKDIKVYAIKSKGNLAHFKRFSKVREFRGN